jgi:glycosyltransferase involved in cell wall biosynthesis
MPDPKTNFAFHFYRYIQPIWYFSRQPETTVPYWVDYKKLNTEEQALINLDHQYSTEEAMLRDASYQAWYKGIMHIDSSFGLTLPFTRLPVEDEYRFIKKYFNPIWSFYILIVRIFSFRNPFVEMYSFGKSWKVRRTNIFNNPKPQPGYESFQSALMAQAPLVSVIIPTLNRQVYLKDVLADLAAQEYKNFEVIIVDQNEKLDDAFYSNWPFALHAIHQKEKALWLARNTAVRMAKGDYLLLFDDDSRVAPGWIGHHIKCIDYFQCQLSAGVSISVVGASVPQSYSYFRWADQLDTGNVMIKKEVFKKIGLFDRQFERQRMGDGEFGLRAFLAGFQSVSNPHADRLHLKVETGGLRQMGSWDGFRPTNWFAPRPIPSVLYYGRKYFGNRLAFLDLMIKVPPSLLPFKFKGKPVMTVMSMILGIFTFPMLIFQVSKSWSIASKMLKEGAKVSRLNADKI